MARHLHIYIHTRDAGWKESAHPRAANGEFGSGSGGLAGSVGSAAGGAVKLKGDELGDYTDMRELRQKALAHAQEKFVGKAFSNRATGNEITVTRSGVKHTIAGASDTLVRSIPAIPAMLQSAKLVKREPDKHGRSDVLSIEVYSAPVEIGGERHEAILTVKHYVDGRRYYDHGLVK
ncbi:hypothetical protein C7405_101658 [Paraburkholderia caballeronis]|uniref:LPD3 domain-containing protein n=1 Tax=Paraburkholderia caballeronis TaxID=416943 RepID=UPI0010D2212F|nr:hypothetical protein [Paraburkholderia caballeronis]TDV39539.1 hypothetical protein C7405_101658 [Paraburkholderia caballeronis]